MSANSISVYDEVPYPSLPYALTHPHRLGAIARLCGVAPAPFELCRVLELGCGAGGNLLPMAAFAPGSSFLGVDLSEGQIAEGRSLASRSELRNVELAAADLLRWKPPESPFDYIIAHGLFSWTTPAARERILELCRQCLSPTGVACINFNAYPSWHLLGMLREMLTLPERPAASPRERIAAARQRMRFLRETLPSSGSPYATPLLAELDQLERQPDPYLFHAYLNVVNQPFTLSAFREFAERNGLRLLGDSDPAATWPELANPNWQVQLRAASGDPEDWAQLADFARLASSRRAILCRAETPAERGPVWSAVAGLSISSRLKPLHDGSTERGIWRTPEGQRITGVPATLDQSLRVLADHAPGQVHGTALVGANSGTDGKSQELLHAWCHQLLQIAASPVGAANQIPDRPLAIPFTRAQAADGDRVTTATHQSLRISANDRQLLDLADGSHSVDQLGQRLGRDCTESVRHLFGHGLLR